MLNSQILFQMYEETMRLNMLTPEKVLKTLVFTSSIILIAAMISGCGNNLPEDKSIGDKSYSLVNQDSNKVVFPNDFKGKSSFILPKAASFLSFISVLIFLCIKWTESFLNLVGLNAMQFTYKSGS